MTIQELESKIITRIEEAIKRTLGEKAKIELIFPPKPEFGDFAVECFILAKKFQKSPAEIASLIVPEIKPDGIIAEAKNAGPYVNIKINNSALFSFIEEVSDVFPNLESQKEKIMVEYLGPNTNKPLHLGHARNGVLGITLSNILQKNGFEVLKANIINDRGVHICKSILAYQKWGNDSTPESMSMKSDHFVGYWYVKYDQELKNSPELENEVQEMLQKWERGDEETLALWKKMNKWVYAGWKTTMDEMGFDFDVVNYESETYKLGKDIIEQGLKKGIFERNESGAVIFNLPEEGFGLNKDGSAKKLTLIRPDGTSVYITQDIGTAVSRFEKYDLDRLIYVVANEQDYHFKCLFKILESLGYDWAKNLYHLSYGIVKLPDGRMKSREGNVVDTDDLIKEMKKLAEEELKKRYEKEKIDVEDLKERARKIGIGAIKFYFSRVSPEQDIEFNPQESISFDGFTGPYCQYAYARIASILRKADNISRDIDYSVLGENIEERELIQKIIQFPDIIKKVSSTNSPSSVASYVFEIAQLFNKFYQKHPVLNAENEELKKARLGLIRAVQTIIKTGLNLLEIETLEKM